MHTATSPQPPSNSPQCQQCGDSTLSPRLLNKDDVRLRIGVKGKSTLDDMIRDGRFPKPSAYMNRKPFWTLDVVDIWIDELLAKNAV